MVLFLGFLDQCLLKEAVVVVDAVVMVVTVNEVSGETRWRAKRRVVPLNPLNASPSTRHHRLSLTEGRWIEHRQILKSQ